MMSLIQRCSAVRVRRAFAKSWGNRMKAPLMLSLSVFFFFSHFSCWSSNMVFYCVSKKTGLCVCFLSPFFRLKCLSQHFSFFSLSVLFLPSMLCLPFKVNSVCWTLFVWNLRDHVSKNVIGVCDLNVCVVFGLMGLRAALWCGRSLSFFRDSQMMSRRRASGPCNYHQCPTYGSVVCVCACVF